MSKADLQSRLIPLMSRKWPLSRILKALSDIPAERVTEVYDSLTFEAYDIDLAYEAAA